MSIKNNNFIIAVFVIWSLLATAFGVCERIKFNVFRNEIAKARNNEQPIRDQLAAAQRELDFVHSELDGITGELDGAIGIARQSNDGFAELGKNLGSGITEVRQLIERQRAINEGVNKLQGQNKELTRQLESIRGTLTSGR